MDAHPQKRKGFQKKPLKDIRLQTNAAQQTMSRMYYQQSTKKSLVNVTMKLNPFQSVKPPSDDVLFKHVGEDDMIKMNNLTSESLLDNLKRRYESDIIYTRVHTILVAINPFKMLPIYSAHILKKYVGKQIHSMPPHVYGVTESAFTSMRTDRVNQSLIISGESGAGKSETCRLALQYLSGRTDKGNNTTSANVETMILETVPVLEAFGNAKTVRNNNSSRFGKYIEIQFDNHGSICGARITSYLLEKSRVCWQAETERNYHIFYQMTEGASAEEKARYKLGGAMDYNYLNKSGCIKLGDVVESAEWEQFKQGLSVLKIVEDQPAIFSILAAVLHLGNIDVKKAGEKASIDDNDPALVVAAQLLSIKPSELKQGLLQKVAFMGREKVTMQLNFVDAVACRDALAKILYSKLFDWLLAQINHNIHRPDSATFMGILDIFGFENFKRNSFEQFCINFANERLQHFFNHHIFKMEQEEYDREKIDWSSIDFKDNQKCIDLIEGMRPPGIIPLLNEESNFPKGSDVSFLRKVTESLGKQKHLVKANVKEKTPMFGVDHYAGHVMYETAGFLDKNRDTVPDHFPTMFQTNPNTVLKVLFQVTPAEAPSAGPGKRGGKGGGRTTVGSNFKKQLGDLMQVLSSTSPFFVRCIKPNATKTPNNFDDAYISEQLTYSGMFETIRIRRMGYPQRYTHADFIHRYKCLNPSASGDVKSLVTALAGTVKDPKGIQVGLTKVFMRFDEHRELESRRGEALKGHAVKIQAWWRMVVVMTAFRRKKAAAFVVQNVFRKWRAWNALKQLNAAVMKKLQLDNQAKKLEEERRRKEAEEARKKAEEAAALQRAEQEAARKQAEAEAARQRAEQEAARKQQAAALAAQRAQAESAAKQAAAQEDTAARQKEAAMLKQIAELKASIAAERENVKAGKRAKRPSAPGGGMNAQQRKRERRRREEEYFQNMLWTVMDGFGDEEIVKRALSKDEMLVEAALNAVMPEHEYYEQLAAKKAAKKAAKRELEGGEDTSMGSRGMDMDKIMADVNFDELESEFKNGAVKQEATKAMQQAAPDYDQYVTKNKNPDPNGYLNYFDYDKILQKAIRESGGSILPDRLGADCLTYEDYDNLLDENEDDERRDKSTKEPKPPVLDSFSCDAIICEALHLCGIQPLALASNAGLGVGGTHSRMDQQSAAMQAQAQAMHGFILKEAGFA